MRNSLHVLALSGVKEILAGPLRAVLAAPSLVVLAAFVIGCRTERETIDGGQGTTDAGGDSAADALDVLPCGQAFTTCPEILYQRPRATQPTLSMANDGKDLFWIEDNFAQGAWIVRAPISGTGPVVRIAKFTGNDRNNGILAEAGEFLFWRANSVLHRFTKSTGEVATLDMGAKLNRFGALTTDETFVYAWDASCGFLTLIPRAVPAQGTWGQTESFSIHELAFQGGITGVAVDDKSAYCGNGRELWTFEKQSRKSHLLLQLGELRRAGPLTVAMGLLYHIEHGDALGRMLEMLTVWRPDKGIFEDLGKTIRAAAVLLPDMRRQQIYWTTGIGGNELVSRFVFQNNQIDVLAERQVVEGGGRTTDDSFIYWQGHDRIVRLRKPD